MLDRTCDLYPHKAALVAGEVRLTYRQLREWTDRAAIAFLDKKRLREEIKEKLKKEGKA